MPIDYEQLTKLNADYSDQKGLIAKNFFCPIILEDDPNAELCNGHILNEGIKQTSRAKVIQRKDVDNHFGYTIEPDLIKFVNINVSTPEERINSAKVTDRKIISPSGEKLSIFFDKKPKTRERFQQIDIFNSDGTHYGSPFLKNGGLEPMRYKSIEVEWTISLSNSAIVGSFLKSAYLALFRIFGYRWVFSVAGEKIRQALALFYQEGARKDQAIKYFGEFDGSFAIVLNDGLQGIQDTLEGGFFLFHHVDGNRDNELLFGLTCLFRINGQIYAVTMPGSQEDDYHFVAYKYYQAFLKDRSTGHRTYLGRFDKDGFDVLDTPLKLHYAARPQ